ncbi:hypothetical protein [Armatimonas rosea]|uniref:Uncharacterized protein n=1 Tax=Armatimonas rosea TaxID=685828 RepID=A0A7W9SSI3_ARMRO|nr:hypothetical protein [Armatimonas rosea]MBB6051253.1 hypothetical protein [Armatimonas rosea]
MIDFQTGTLTTDDGLTLGRGVHEPEFLVLVGERARKTFDFDRWHDYELLLTLGGEPFFATLKFELGYPKKLRLVAADTGIQANVRDLANKPVQAHFDTWHRNFLKRQYGASLPKKKSFPWGQVRRDIDLLGSFIELRFYVSLRG